jgi:hypothetical protein
VHSAAASAPVSIAAVAAAAAPADVPAAAAVADSVVTAGAWESCGGAGNTCSQALIDAGNCKDEAWKVRSSYCVLYHIQPASCHIYMGLRCDKADTGTSTPADHNTVQQCRRVVSSLVVTRHGRCAAANVRCLITYNQQGIEGVGIGTSTPAH